MVCCGRRATANSYRFETLFVHSDGALHSALMADVQEEESSQVISLNCRGLHRCDRLVDWTVCFNSDFGILEWYVVFSLYHTSDAENVIVNRRWLGLGYSDRRAKDQQRQQFARHRPHHLMITL